MGEERGLGRQFHYVLVISEFVGNRVSSESRMIGEIFINRFSAQPGIRNFSVRCCEGLG